MPEHSAGARYGYVDDQADTPVRDVRVQDRRDAIPPSSRRRPDEDTPSETPVSRGRGRGSRHEISSDEIDDAPPRSRPSQQLPPRPPSIPPFTKVGNAIKGWTIVVAALSGAIGVFVAGWEMKGRQESAALAATASTREQINTLDVRIRSIELTMARIQTDLDWVVRTLAKRQDTSTELNVQAHAR